MKKKFKLTKNNNFNNVFLIVLFLSVVSYQNFFKMLQF